MPLTVRVPPVETVGVLSGAGVGLGEAVCVGGGVGTDAVAVGAL